MNCNPDEPNQHFFGHIEARRERVGAQVHLKLFGSVLNDSKTSLSALITACCKHLFIPEKMM